MTIPNPIIPEAPMANAIDDVEEWVLVPKDITPDMQQALIENAGKTTVSIWVNLLAAAPPSPAPQHTGWSDEAVEAMAKHLCESLCRVDWNSIPDASSEDRGFPAWKVYGYYNAGKEDFRRMVRAALSASSIAPATRMPHSGVKVSDIVAMIDADTIAPATGFEVKAQTYPKLRQVRAHKPSCANVQVGSTYADKCDCGALDTAGRAIDISPSVAKESWEP